MAYKKGPVGHMKSSTENKAVSYMAEGSAAYMETMGQEKKNLMKDMPIDNRGISQMSPYKMDYASPAKKTDPETTVDEFGTPIPEGFKADAKGVTGTVRPLSSIQGVDTSASNRRERSQLVEGGLSEGEDFASGGFATAQLIKEGSQPITTRENLSAKQKKAVMQSRSYSGKKSPRDVAKILGINPTITTVKVDK